MTVPSRLRHVRKAFLTASVVAALTATTLVSTTGPSQAADPLPCDISTLFIASNGGPNPFDTTTSWAADTTWAVTAPWTRHKADRRHHVGRVLVPRSVRRRVSRSRALLRRVGFADRVAGRPGP